MTTDLFQLEFVQRAVLEILLLSVGAGLIGTWIVLRSLAFYSHAVATATFPGLVLAAGLGFAAPLGAIVAALFYAASVFALGARGREGDSNLTALTLAGSLALGVLLASDVFHSGSGIESLLFGSLLVIGQADLWIAAGASAVVLLAAATVGHIWTAAGFDHESAVASGAPVRATDVALFSLIAIVVVAMLSALGALLAAAVLVIPAATTRLLTTRMSTWQLATVALVAVEGVVGIWIAVEANVPPGSAIAVLGGVVFALVALGRQVVRAGSVRGVTAVAALPVLAVAITGCGGSESTDQNKLNVVATTTQIGDWARQVGGSNANVTQILQPNTDPHEYEPRPSDVRAVANADLVLTNGDNLDAWAGKLIAESGGDPGVIDLGKQVPQQLPGESEGPEASQYDPHWWHDIRNAEAAVDEIRRTYSKSDPKAAADFDRNAARYSRQLRDLDRSIAACVSRIPARQRKLVTDHDAFGYFANRYGLDVVGAVIPSQTTQAQPSAGEVSKLIDTIKREHVRAVFPESSVNARLARQIAQQTGATSDNTLYGDTLGPEDSSGATYLAMESANAGAVVDGLSGGRVTCALK